MTKMVWKTNSLETTWEAQMTKTMESRFNFTSIPHLHNLDPTILTTKVVKG